MKQTAVEWLVKEFDLISESPIIKNVVNQAKEMEKQQKDKFAIDFLDSIKEYERENGSRICFDERDSKELLEIFKNK